METAAPIGASQVGALLSVAARELSWTLPTVSRLMERWRQRALMMPPSPIRDDALASLDSKRLNTEGAALFATLPRRRHKQLLRLLVAYEVMWDLLDSLSERPCEDIVGNGLQLHRALHEALDPRSPISDYYLHHPWKDDGGYLRALVEECRTSFAALPSSTHVRPHVCREALRAQVSAINHEPDPARRDSLLEAFARREWPRERDVLPFELTAAASSSLTVHALLALAAEPCCAARDVASTYAAYFPWISLASTMLDSYADLAEDIAEGAHSYISHYPSLDVAVARLREVVWRSADLARRLPRGRRHALVATGMVAMYLTKDSTRTAELRKASRSILHAPGPLPSVMLPIMRTWRLVSARSSQ